MVQELTRKAFIVIDMQEDFCSPSGAYAQGGMDIGPTRVILPALDKLLTRAKQAGIPQIATLFTIFEDVNGAALVAPHLLTQRPFLQKSGFRVGAPGQEFSRELPPPSHTIVKPRYSAFYQTPLDILLKSMRICEVVVCGITANGGVSATVRDAHLRDIPATVIRDGVASFTETAKERALQELSGIAEVMTADEWISRLWR